MSRAILLAIALGLALGAPTLRADNLKEDPSVTASRLFRRLTGVPLQISDPRLAQMAALIREGHTADAAAIATEDPYFYQITVKNVAAEVISRSAMPYIGLDDAQATFIGTVADELDARGLLTGDYIYRSKMGGPEPSRGNNSHYERIDSAQIDYKSALVKQEPQWTGPEAMRNHAGVMTTRGWAWNYDGGTNRRAVVNSFGRFLCRPFGAWKVPYLDETSVGRDVDRNPGGNPRVFQEQCRTCHASQDPMRDAFAYLDFLNSTLVELPDKHPAPKYSRWTYQQGHATYEDYWVNVIAPYKPELGFRPELTSGKGVRAYGEMMADSQAFASCMTERVFSSVCQRAPDSGDSAIVGSLTSSFEKNGYNLKKLFEETAATPACLERSGVKTFNSLYHSLSSALGVKPTKEIEDFYKKNMTSLPPFGRAEEVSTDMLVKLEGLAGLFCAEFTKNNSGLAKSDPQSLLSELSKRIYGRGLTPKEASRFTTFVQGSQVNSALIACTAIVSSPAFWVQ